MTNNILKYLEWLAEHSKCDDACAHRPFDFQLRNEFPKLLSAMREMVGALNDIGNHWCGYSAEHASEDWKILLEEV